MLDARKLALEALIYGQPSPRRTSDAQRVQARTRELAMMRSVGDLRRRYVRLCTTTPYRECAMCWTETRCSARARSRTRPSDCAIWRLSAAVTSTCVPIA